MATNQAIVLREDQAVMANRSAQITDVQRLGGLLAASGYFADAREMAQAAVKVMAGEELGIPPVAAMMGINIIKGKIALGGNLIASRIRAHGFDFIHKRFDNEGCVLTFLGRKGDPDIGKGLVGTRPIIGESSFTMEDAKTAQVTGNEHYKKNPRNMLFNRAISNGAKWYTPEVFAGAPVYVPEELGAKVDEQGDFVPNEPTIEQRTEARQQALDRKLTEIKAARSEATPPSAAEAEQPPPSTLDQILSTFTGAAAITRAFDQMKEHFCKLLDESVYLQILKENGMGEDGTRTIKSAKACFKVLWATYQRELAIANEQGQEPAE